MYRSFRVASQPSGLGNAGCVYAWPSPVTVSPLQGRVLFPRQLYIGSSTSTQACGTFTRSIVDFLTQLPWGAF